MRPLISALTSIALVCGLILLTAPSDAHDDNSAGKKHLFTKHFQKTLFDITERGAYSLEILLDDNEYKIGKGLVGIVVHGEKDSDVTGAQITIGHKNLATGETAPGVIAVIEKGDGLYLVSGLDLGRVGRWALGITVKKGDATDSLTFNFPEVLKERHPKGTYSP